jgi:ubiquinone/menaquinone biosynthesis C-methylase UbiE
MMTTYRETILKMYNDRKLYDTEEGTQHPRQAEELVDASRLKAGDLVLDVATGTGLVVLWPLLRQSAHR